MRRGTSSVCISWHLDCSVECTSLKKWNLFMREGNNKSWEVHLTPIYLHMFQFIYQG
jgi:hypothetical protein